MLSHGQEPPFEHLVVDVLFYRQRTSIVRRLTTHGTVSYVIQNGRFRRS